MQQEHVPKVRFSAEIAADEIPPAIDHSFADLLTGVKSQIRESMAWAKLFLISSGIR